MSTFNPSPPGARLTWAVAGVLAVAASVSMTLWLASRQIENLHIVDGGETQLTLEQAEGLCQANYPGSRLPTVIEMLGIYYFSDQALRNRTDYWTRTRLLGHGFGVNTHLGILSFDVPEDEDHFLCVTERTATN